MLLKPLGDATICDWDACHRAACSSLESSQSVKGSTEGNSVVLCKLFEQAADQLAHIDANANIPAWSSEMFRTEFQQQHSHIFGARHSGDIVGFLVGHLTCDEVHLMNFAVRYDFRRRGIGTSLLTHCLSYFFDLGARWATLEVRESNAAAMQLYQDRGFQIAGRRNSYYSDNNEDALIMKVDLALLNS